MSDVPASIGPTRTWWIYLVSGLTVIALGVLVSAGWHALGWPGRPLGWLGFDWWGVLRCAVVLALWWLLDIPLYRLRRRRRMRRELAMLAQRAECGAGPCTCTPVPGVDPQGR